MNCKRCGYCCTLIPKIGFWEMIRIMSYGHLNFTEKDSLGRRCLKLIQGECCFLRKKPNGGAMCSIYNIRPQVCRDFPYKGAKECNADKRCIKERIFG